MNKQKFENKCKEIYAHEDEMLAKMNELIKPYNEELNKRGYEMVCRLLWSYPRDEEDISLERLPIVFRKVYFCSMSLQFQEIGADYYESEGDGFQLFDEVSSYGCSLWLGWIFKKYDCKYICDNFEYYYKKVISDGLAQTAKAVLKNV